MKHIPIFILVCFLGLQLFAGSPSQAQSPQITVSNAAQVGQVALLGRGQAFDVAWSPDGLWLGVASATGVWVYSIPSLLISPSTANPIHWQTAASAQTIAFSPTEPILAAGLSNGTVILWNWLGDEPRSLNAHSQVTRDLAFSADGTLLATTGQDEFMDQEIAARLWDTTTLGLVSELRDPSNFYDINTLAMSADGQWLATADNGGEIKLWQLSTGALTKQWDAHFWEIQDIAFAPDSQWLISGATDEDVRAWNITTASQIAFRSYSAGGEVYAVAISPDGTRSAALTSEPELHIALTTGGLQAVVDLPGKSGLVGAVAFSPDNTLIATVGGDGETHLRLWDVSGNLPVEKAHIPAFYHGFVAVVEANGQLLGVSSDRMVQRWGADLAYTGFWDMQTQHAEAISAAAISPDGTTLVTGDEAGSVRRWVVADQRYEVQFTEGEHVNAVAFSPDGSRLMFGGQSKVVQVWQQPTPQLLYRLQSGSEVNALAVRPATATLAIGLAWSGAIELWDINTGAYITALPNSHFSDVGAIVFSADGEVMVSAGGEYDGSLAFWNANQNLVTHKVDAHEGGALALAISRDDTVVASGGSDGRVLLWETRTGTLLTELVGHSGAVTDVTFSADGTRLYSAGVDGTVRVWAVR